jgi:hypothetical protein
LTDEGLASLDAGGLTSGGLSSGGLAGRLVKDSSQRENFQTAQERQLESAPMTGAELKQLGVDLGSAEPCPRRTWRTWEPVGNKRFEKA